MKHKKKKKINPYWILLVILVVILIIVFTQKSSPEQEQNNTDILIEEEIQIQETQDNPFQPEPEVIEDETPQETSEENETTPSAGGSSNNQKDSEQIAETLPPDEEETFIDDINRSDLYVLDGDFEMEDNYLEYFRDFDNYPKTGYIYTRNTLSPINGEKDLKIKVTSAKKESYNRPAFIADLSRNVSKDNRYVVTLKLRTVKGTPDLYGLGFGETIYAFIDYDHIDERTTSYLFDMTTDVSSNEMYIYFNGTTIKEFRLDDLEIN